MIILNRNTRITASTLGTLLGGAGIFNHGLFEILQGSTPTNGYFIEAIGETQRYWIHGTEAAFTLIPNFLITGICAVLIGLSVILWSIKYIHKDRGSTVFLLLMILIICLIFLRLSFLQSSFLQLSGLVSLLSL